MVQNFNNQGHDRLDFVQRFVGVDQYRFVMVSIV